jgi:hypothetical protein
LHRTSGADFYWVVFLAIQPTNLAYLIAKLAKGLRMESVILDSIEDAVVEELGDGGMGSLKFCQSIVIRSALRKATSGSNIC